MEQNKTVSIKLSLSASKKRVRLDVPLKISQLQQQVRTSFPSVKQFGIFYVDDEGDTISVTSDEDLIEAQSVFKHLGRVISFVVDTSDNPVQSTATAATCKSSNRPKASASKSSTLPQVHACKSPEEKSASTPKSRDTECNFDHLRKMASIFFENPGCIDKIMRSYLGCTETNTSPSEGDVVELHSLSTANFNGRRGRCGRFNRQTGRYLVELFATKTARAQTIAVRNRNIKVVAADPAEKSSEERDQLWCTKTSFGPGSFGSDVVTLQKVLIKLGYMHPSAIRFAQGFYGPHTTAAVAKIAKSIGCDGNGVFTDRVRAHLLDKLAPVRKTAAVSLPTKPTSTVSVPTKVTTTVPVPTKPTTTVSVPTKPAAEVFATAAVSVPTKVIATVSVPTEPTAEVSVPTNPTTAVSVPTKVIATVSAPTQPTVPTKVKQLLDMGFALPVDTLVNVLAAANDDVGAALTALVGRG